MSDSRFPSPGVDARFPAPGVDAEFPSPGVDARHPSPGEDARYTGGGYGNYGGLIQNGDFKNGATNWTVAAPTVTFNSNKMQMSSSGTPASVYQALASQFWTGGKYTVTFTIDSISSGSVTPKVGGTAGTTRSAPGTYAEVITAGGSNTRLTLDTSNTSNMVIDNIKVELYALIPQKLAAPVMTGTGLVGTTLSLDNGAWAALPASLTYTYQWYADGVLIPGETAASYVVQVGQLGKTITGKVTATNSEGSTQSNASNGVVVTTLTLPSNSVAPVISGSAVAGSTLSGTNGTWSGSPPITYEYKWQADGVDIPGEIASSFVSSALQSGKAVRMGVRATNSVGTSAWVYSNTITVTTVPQVVINPTIIGTPLPRQTLTCSPGTSNGYPAATPSYQWKANGVNIGGATSPTFVIPWSLVGVTAVSITCAVTWTNSAGNVSRDANTLILPVPSLDPPSLDIGASYVPGDEDLLLDMSSVIDEGDIVAMEVSEDDFATLVKLDYNTVDAAESAAQALVFGVSPLDDGDYEVRVWRIKGTAYSLPSAQIPFTVDVYSPSLDFSDARNSMYL